MAIFRVHKTDNYTVMANNHLFNKKLSNKAKGLLCVMLALPPEWNYTLAGLASLSSDGKDAVRAQLKELQKAGYVSITKLYPNHTEDGKIHYVYDIYEIPQEQVAHRELQPSGHEISQSQANANVANSRFENQYIENQYIENQYIENPTLLNTNILNTNILNTNILNTNKERERDKEREKTPTPVYGKYKNVFLSETELNNLKVELPDKWQYYIDRLSTYTHTTGKSYKNHAATICKWAQEDAAKTAPNNGMPDYSYGPGEEEEEKELWKCLMT